MLLLHFLEICIGDFNLWPSYIFDLLFLKAASPRHIGETAAFFYGHKVPLKVACRVYAICNPDRAVHDAIPFFMGAYYAAYYYQCNCNIWHGISTFDAASFSGSTAEITHNPNRSFLPTVAYPISIAGPYDDIGCRRVLRTPYTLT